MNKKRIVVLIIFCTLIAGTVYLLTGRKNAEYVSEVSQEAVDEAYQLLFQSLSSKEIMYTDYLKYTTSDNGTGETSAEPDSGEMMEDYESKVAILDYNNSVQYEINVESKGYYYLLLDYKPMGETLSDFIINVKVNDENQYYEMKTIALPFQWEDETKDYKKDSYGDESAPKLIRSEEWSQTYLYNNTYSSAEPLVFLMEAGKNIITVTNVSSDGLGIGRLTAKAPELNIPTYSEYTVQNPGEVVTDYIKINSIDYIKKNTTQAIYSSENNPVLTPHDAKYKKLNVLSWSDAGTELTYGVKVEKDGLYELAFHYKNEKEEFQSFQTIKIDGKVPFIELMNYPFESTGNGWSNEVLSDSEGNPYYIYLTAGTHTLSIRTEEEPVVEAWRYARLITEHVTQFSLQITKITGSDTDKNRTWKMTKYIPEIAEYLEAYETLIQHIRYLLQDYTPNGINGALLADLNKAMQFIEKMSEYPDEIALYTEELTGKDNSVLVAISNFTTEIKKEDFSLDMIYVYGNHELPKATPGIFASAKNQVATLLNSFTSDKYSVETDEDVLTVWVNRALTHVDLMQKMADTDFTERTGIKVKISAMPDANKLTMAVAAEQTPDVALGLSSYMPFDLASRGALYDMTQFDDFWTVANRFVAGAFVPYVYNEGVYAIPETLDFNAIVYRTDIFDNLGLVPPNTWQDVIDMLPELQRYGMNFYHNISSGVGYKWFYQTTPFIFQNNGRLYTEDGLMTAIDEPNSVKGLQQLGNLFIAYSLDTQVNSFFNSFRYSILPVGIVDSSQYILLKNGAPELEGQWALADYPGTVQEDGSISRWYVANGTGGIIFKASDKTDEAWKFMKWWTDHSTQVDYTYTLQSTYGKEFFWLPSNIDALEDAPIDQEDKQVILEQVKWLRDVPRTPGQYLLERSISDIWNTMVFDGTSAQVAIDEKTIAINREMIKKMKELGYYNDEGNLLKNYVIRDVDWIQYQMDEAKEKGE